MSANRSRRGERRPARVAVSVITGLALIVSTHGAAAQAAPGKPADPPWKPAPEKPVPVRKVQPQTPGTDPGERFDLRATPRVSWPAAGVADAEVPGQTTGAPSSWLSPSARSTSRGPVPPSEVDRGRAGSLPVWVGPAPDPSGRAAARVDVPIKVRVESQGRRGDGLGLRIGRSDGVKKPGRVELRVGYQDFRHAFGGDWAARLRLVQVSPCALANKPGCVPRLLPTRNDGKGVLTADVIVPADGAAPAQFAVLAGPSSGTGDFGATSLTPAATWTVGGSSGDFNWNYPMDLPPGIGGPAPQMSLTYSSGGVDGRTSATNNQPGWAGEGFDLSPGGSIERRYASCASKTEKTGNNGSRITGDLCFATDNATFTLNGMGGELVRDDQSGTWHPRNDNGSKVEKLSGADNGDDGRTAADKGEYWKLTTKDGTEYYFGLNKLAETDARPTASTWRVPVFGNHSGEQCYTPGNFAASWCHQAYRWNLDYVKDRHGNTMTLFYDTETGYYGRNATATAVTDYTRAGNVKRIEYGQRHGQVFSTPAVAQVQFTTAERCVAGSACTTSQPETYPDTPLDRACLGQNGQPPTKCDNRYNPTFFTTKRLAKVTSQVWRGAGFADVDSWTLRHSFRDPGDNVRNAGLWLEAITNAGHVGPTPLQMPEVTFASIPKANRVDAGGDYGRINWLRVSEVHYGTGGRIAVRYSDEDCLPGGTPANAADNTRLCHPLKWTPDGSTTERTDWWHKYVVKQVTETDLVSGQEPAVTHVDYLSPPAWHHDDADGLVDINQKTWAQWRGYEHVRVRKGKDGTPQTVTETRYFRGMHGDRKSEDGGTKEVKITDSTGTKVVDEPPLAGQTREQSRYIGTQLVDRTITDLWVSAATATRVRPWGTTEAFQTEQGANKQTETLAGGTTRESLATNTYDSSGVLTSRNDLNNVADPNDDTCTSYKYAENAGLGIAELPKQEQTVSVACGKPFTNEQVVADNRTYYDGATSEVDTPPTTGDVTRVERLAGFNPDGKPKYEMVREAKYDPIGRATLVRDALQHETRTAFTPVGAGPVTKTTVTQPNGHTTVTELEPAWGEEIAIVDPAGRRTEATYDAFGRTTKVWLPGRTGASIPDGDPASRPGGNVAGLTAAADNASVPNMEYGYTIAANEPNAVMTKALQANGTIDTSYELSDGLLRKVQTQQSAPGGDRIVTHVRYDSRGLPTTEDGPFYAVGLPSGSVVVAADEQLLPIRKITDHDLAGRAVKETFRSMGQDRWFTTHVHSGDRQTVEPPAGDQATTRLYDVQGRVTQLWQYTGASASGTPDKTGYTYNARGQITSITDPASNKWTFVYDERGRKIRETDPDKGTTTYTYTDLDQVSTSTDASGTTLEYTYDEIGRKKAVHQQTPQGKKLLSEWAYDTLAKGSPTSATRWAGGQPYTTRVTGYNEQGKPLGAEVVIPASEGTLAGTYTTTASYKPDGEIATTTLPGIGGLPAEELTYGYNDQDRPTTLISKQGSVEQPLVQSTAYTAFGEVEQVVLGPTGVGQKAVKLGYEYEDGTRRLSRTLTQRETAPSKVSDVRYTYDPAGNITKISDTPSSTSGEPTDTQCFTYDHLRRLTSAWTPAPGPQNAPGDCSATPSQSTLGGPSPYWHSWTFDKSGNRKTETRTTAAGSTTATYTYPTPGPDAVRPHAVSKVVTTGTGMPAGGRTDTYHYTATGDQKLRTRGGASETFDWSVEGGLEKVTGPGGTTENLYDADGNRLLRRDPSGTTLYLGDTELLLKPGAASPEGTRYYKHGEQTVAVRTGGKLTWLGADHHGTSHIAIEDTSQQTVHRRRMDPFGNIRGTASAAWPGQRGFVGGADDPSTGLVHLGAREYDPTLGRFISVDPEMDVQDPQTLNGYSYANNSPVSFSDPDGRSWFSDIVSSISTVAQTVVNRVVETVKEVVDVVVPVIHWVQDQVTNVVEQVQNFVHKTVEVVKQVVKTVKKVVKKVVKTVRAVAKKIGTVAKKATSAVKDAAKTAYRNTKAGLAKANRALARANKALVDAKAAVGKAVMDAGKWAWDHRREIAHHAISIGVGIAATAGAAALCGATAGLGCVLVAGALIGSVAGAAANSGVAAAMGEEVTTDKVIGWGVSSIGGGATNAVRGAVGLGGGDLAKAALRGWSGAGGLKQTLNIGSALLTSPKMWRATIMSPR